MVLKRHNELFQIAEDILAVLFASTVWKQGENQRLPNIFNLGKRIKKARLF